ncbi:MAG: carboxylating nicotinate-nucleotide diphosphorylase [Candidatus Aureabacteria bacterium]|nr:carboxylating nicotinate-nucleotide diphosphorylase [Candidatus Auribacterota bacterium]
MTDNAMQRLDPAIIKDLVARALEEDIGAGDITTIAMVPPADEANAEILAKEPCIIAGLPVAEAVFRQLDPRVEFNLLALDGSHAARGERLALVKGPAGSILTGERTALNFLQRLSGIATFTREFVHRVRDTGATILDTRKTTPGLRHLEKYAVTAGGGTNHRMGLFDRILIKDNHLAIQERFGPDAIARAVTRVRAAHPGAAVEIEADTLEAVEAALNARAECILLDNMTVGELREAVELVNGRAATEASGGITLDNVREVALTGVQYISIGALTHSAPAVDISLEVMKEVP